MAKPLTFALLLVFPLSALAVAQATRPAGTMPVDCAWWHDDQPSLTVSGESEVTAAPDRAVVRLGATAQAKTAEEAQSQVNRIMQDAVKRIKELGIPLERIQTATLSLSPVYEQPTRDRGGEQRIVAYRAQNTVQVDVDELGKIGPVVDAAVAVGANELQGVAFELRDDLQQRQRALAAAVKQVRAKAQTLAEAAGVRLVSVAEVNEGAASVRPPQPMMARAGMEALAASTPVQPGEVQIRATVSLRYRIAP